MARDHFFHCYSLDALINVDKIREWFSDHVAEDDDETEVQNLPERLSRAYTSPSYKKVLENKLSGWNKFPKTVEGIKKNVIRNHLIASYKNDPYFKKIILS